VQIYSNEGYLKPCAYPDYFVYSNVVAADPARPPSLYLSHVTLQASSGGGAR
jgi:hypothetical protein